MAMKLHSLINGTAVPAKLMPGKDHRETLLAILGNFSAKPSSIEPVAQQFVSKYKTTLYKELADPERKVKLSQDEYVKLQPVLMFLRYGGK